MSTGRSHSGNVSMIEAVWGRGRPLWLPVAAMVVTLIVAWVIVIFAVEQAQFVIVTPQGQVGVEAASALARLFGALVLLLFPEGRAAQRMRWVAGGFVILGLGGLEFGYLLPLLGDTFDLNTSMYASLAIWSLAGALFVIGLVPATSPRFTRQWIVVVAALFTGFSLTVLVAADRLPQLVVTASLEVAAVRGDAPLRGLTGWHWTLSTVPLGLAIAAVAGATRDARRRIVGGWIVVAMVLLAGSQLHNLFWPSAYAPVLTTANVLRLAFGITVVIGGILELRRIAADRARLLAHEQEYSRRLAELADLRAEFVSMVAHELGPPLAAIRRFTELLHTADTAPNQATILTTIQSQLDVLNTLVTDVQLISTIERADFAIHPRRVPVGELLAEATAFARTLPGNHTITVDQAGPDQVLADPERISQVLHNLLSNAVAYSPAGTTITLRATPEGDRVRFEVEDHGYGIHPNDLPHIFEKFERGREHRPRGRGTGLGLYLSRKIVEAHASELTVRSTLGMGSVFAFTLEVAR